MMTTPVTAEWLTPAVPAAIGILALHGPAPVFFDRAWPSVGQHRFGRLKTNDGKTVDEIVAIRLDEDHLWLCTHGGPGIRQAVTELCAQHEVVLQDTQQAVNTPTDQTTFSQALAKCSGPAATDWLLQALAQAGDPEQPIPHAPFNPAFLFRRPRLLLTGPANAGKSALLNAWCGYRRAVVSPMPGTTRDLIAAVVDCHGWRCEVVDSAGLRSTDDQLEQAGQDLAKQAREWVDGVLFLAPGDQPGAEDAAHPDDLVVFGKSDLRPDATQQVGLLWQAPEAGNSPLSTSQLEQLNTAVCSKLELPPAMSTLQSF